MFDDGKLIFTGIESPEKPHPLHFWQYSISVLNSNIEDVSVDKETTSGLYGKTINYRKFMSVTPQIYITKEIKNMLQL